MAETEQELALLAHHTLRLQDELAVAVPAWAERCVLSLAPDPGSDEARAAAERLGTLARADTVPTVVRLLESDIDDQWASPLEIVRSLVAPITNELQRLGVTPPARDPRTIELMPDDTFGVTPATFADLDPALHEPGLAWGAAKAHIHIRRHGPTTGPGRPPVVVVFAPELGDRSRFDPFTVTHVRSAGQLTGLLDSTDPDLVIVDLDRTSTPADFRIDDAHVVGFGSHVESERHEAALDAGFDAVMARSVFFRRLPELLAPVVKDQS